MREIHLLRHAKSSWEDASLPDRGRPLAPRGRKAAEAMGRHLLDRGIRPALILCSAATRTRRTLERLGEAVRGIPVSVEEELYLASAGELLARIRKLPGEVESVLLIGHNPGMEELAAMLPSSDPDSPGGAGLQAGLERKFPTGALASFRLPEGMGWAQVAPGTARLLDFVRPRELG